MDVFVLNAIIYAVTLIYIYRKRRKTDVYFWLWASYSIIAIMGPICENLRLHETNDVNLGYKVSFIPLVSSYFCTHIILWPFKYFEKWNFNNVNTNRFKIIVYVSSIPFIIASFFLIVETIATFQMGLGVAYELSHEGEMLFEYGGFIDKIRGQSLTYARIFQPFMVIYSFSNIINYSNRKVSIVLLCLSFLPTLLSGIAWGSRGAMFFSVLNILFYFVVFQNYISIKLKRLLLKTGLIIGFLLIVVSVKITNGRSEEGSIVETSAFDNIVRYFGETPLNSYYFYDKIENHPNGLRFFPEITNEDRKYSSIREYVRYWSFRTGCNTALFKGLWLDCYIEFGFIGALIYILLIVMFFYLLFFRHSNKLYSFPFIVFYYSNFAVYGLFSHGFSGRTSHLSFIYLIIITLVISYITHKNTNESFL